MKIYSIRYADIIVGLVDKLVNIFEVNSKIRIHGRQEMLKRFLIFTEYLFKVGIVLYIIATSGYFLYPIYYYVTFHKIVPLLPSYLPFVDEDTIIGLIILIIFDLNVIIYGLLGSACSDFSFTMVIVNVPILGKIMGDNIIELNDLLENRTDNRIIKAKFKNILLQHLEIIG